VDFGVLDEDCSCEWASYIPSFEILKKNGTIRIFIHFRKLNLFLNGRMSTISYSKDWGQDPFSGRIYFCHSIGLKYGLSKYLNQVRKR
jgi:hypothetical protein